MPVILILPSLMFCIYMLALTIVNESMGVLLFGVLVLMLGNALCTRTNCTPRYLRLRLDAESQGAVRWD